MDKHKDLQCSKDEDIFFLWYYSASIYITLYQQFHLSHEQFNNKYSYLLIWDFQIEKHFIQHYHHDNQHL